MVRAALAVVCFSAAIFGAEPRALAAAAAKLTYVRGPSAERCPDEAALRRLVAERVGYDLFFPWAQKTVVVEVSVGKTHGYSGSVQIVDDHGVLLGQRKLDSKSDDCADLARALALAISIAVDDRSLEYIPPPQMTTPDGTSDAPPAPATSPNTAVPSPAEPSAAAAPAGERPSPSPSRAEQVRYLAQLMPTVAFDAAPATTFGSDAGLSARYRRVSIGLDVRTDLPASKDVGQGASVSTWLVLASLVPCFFLQPTVLLCAMGGAGVFTESGHGLASPRTQSALFLTAGGRLAFEVPLGGRFFFVSHGDALVAITRHDVVVDGIGAGVTSDSVFRIPAVSIVAGAGVGVRL